jgi:hypothetical protein
MSITYSYQIKNAKLDAFPSAIGVSPILMLYMGNIPANVLTSFDGSVIAIAQGALPATYMAPSSNGVKMKTNNWTVTGLTAAGAGQAATFFRIFDSTGTVPHIQGSVTVVGQNGDMTLDTNLIAYTQVLTVNSFTVTSGN